MAHYPKRALGQNFLVDQGIAERIVDAVSVPSGATVVEIGPGRGALSELLARKVEAAEGTLILVELDDVLAPELAERFADRASVEVLHGNILDHAVTDLAGASRRVGVVGNIPYNLTSPILFHLLTPPRPAEIVLMVQREVADRILAPQGTRTYGALSVGVRSVANVEVVLNVSPGSFRPRPRVDSTVIRIVPHHPPQMDPAEEARLRVLTRALFQWRRKQLGKILRDHPALRVKPDDVERALAAAEAEPSDRPETVPPDGLVRMACTLSDVLEA